MEQPREDAAADAAPPEKFQQLQLSEENTKNPYIQYYNIRAKAKDFGLADSIIMCTAKQIKGKVVTGDEYFRNLDETIFIKEQDN